jgi:hypothetical protein
MYATKPEEPVGNQTCDGFVTLLGVSPFPTTIFTPKPPTTTLYVKPLCFKFDSGPPTKSVAKSMFAMIAHLIALGVFLPQSY